MIQCFADRMRDVKLPGNFGWTLRAAACLGLVICGAAPGFAQFRELVARVPKTANAVVLLNVEKAVNSPMGVREGWKKKIEKSFAAGLVRVPPQATNFVLASEMDLEFMQPIWSATVMDLSDPALVHPIAERRGGKVDKLDNLLAVAMPNDTYVVQFGPATIGAMQPANRQSVLRWVREVRAGKKDDLSAYLQKAAGYSDDADTDIIMAFDLEGAFSWERAAKYLARQKDLPKQSDEERKESASALGDVLGVRLGIRLSERAFAKLTIDFRTNPRVLANIAKPLLMQILAVAGLKIDDIDQWKPEIGATTISFSGNLTTSGLQRVMSVIESPSTSESLATDPKSKSSPEQLLSSQAQASIDHYRAVIAMSSDLKKDMDSMSGLGSTSTYCEKYAKRIERLPILNVDPELLHYSSFVAKSLRAAALIARNMGIQSGVRQAQIISSEAGTGYATYGRYGIWGLHG